MTHRIPGRAVSLRRHPILALLLAAACGDDGPSGGSGHLIEAVGSSEVAGTPLDTIPEPLTVRVTDHAGRPAAGLRVTWSTADGGSLLPDSPETDELGIARAVWVLGWRPGQQEARATAGEGETADFTATAEGFPAIALSSGEGRHQCAVAPEGALFCWGPNNAGQLGDGTTTSSEVPVAVLLDRAVQQAVTNTSGFADDDYSCALTTDGEVYCWGGNLAGQLGNGTTTGRLSPGQPSLPPGVYKAISAFGGGVCALAENGDAYCWGDNFGGRFGIGSADPQVPVPTRVAADFPWRQVALGDDRACGVREGGQVYCWGTRPTWLGIDVDTNTVLPLPVQNSPAMDSVTLSGWHQCGITTDRVTHCWGSNHNIGLESSDTLFPYPVPLEVPPNLVSVHSIFKPTFGLGTDGRGYWWGPPPFATGGGPETPEPFSGDIPLRAIGTTGDGTCGLEESTGTVYCWHTSGFETFLVVAVPPPASAD